MAGEKVTIFFDGASKGNPGPAGIGFLISYDEGRGATEKFYRFIGVATNNQAEYTALRESLKEAKRLGANHVHVFSDSELVIRQMKGEYRIKDVILKSIYEEVAELSKAFQKIQFTHIPRERNKEADALANLAVKQKHTEKIKNSPQFFEFCKPDIPRNKAEVLILGLPYEGTVNSRFGAVQGPDAIRNASAVVESYSPFLRRDLEKISFVDDGNIFANGKGKQALDFLAEEIRRRLQGLSVRPVFLGGDHSVTYSVVKALRSLGKKFSLVHLDAHPDFQDSFEGDPWSYASVMRRSKEILEGEIFQLGIRTGTEEELEQASRNNHLFLMDRLEEGLSFVREKTRNKEVYVSFDIDVMDPSLAPGTSNPEYGGFKAEQIRLFLSALKEARVIGLDITEVAPNLDPSGFTPILASQIVRDAVLAWF